MKYTYNEIVQKIQEIRSKIAQIQSTPAQGGSSYRELLKDLQYFQHLRVMMNKKRKD